MSAEAEALERVKEYSRRARIMANETMLPEAREWILAVVDDLDKAIEGDS